MSSKCSIILRIYQTLTISTNRKLKIEVLKRRSRSIIALTFKSLKTTPNIRAREISSSLGLTNQDQLDKNTANSTSLKERGKSRGSTRNFISRMMRSQMTLLRKRAILKPNTKIRGSSKLTHRRHLRDSQDMQLWPRQYRETTSLIKFPSTESPWSSISNANRTKTSWRRTSMDSALTSWHRWRKNWNTRLTEVRNRRGGTLVHWRPLYSTLLKPPNSREF